MITCVYCNEPITNEELVDTRGGHPIHPACNAELNEELAQWELASGIVPESPYAELYDERYGQDD